MNDRIESVNFSIVAIGPFNPAVFQPSWFANQNLVGKKAADAATEESVNFVLVSNLSKFMFDVIEVTVQNDRFQLATTREDALSPMLDLFVGTMNLIEPSSANAVGLNIAVHFPTGSEKSWHAAGDLLSGKSFWNEIWPDHAGLLNLQLMLKRTDGFSGAVNVQVQPSNNVKFGVYTSINDHFEFESAKSAKEIGEFVFENWLSSLKRSQFIIDKIIERTANE